MNNNNTKRSGLMVMVVGIAFILLFYVCHISDSPWFMEVKQDGGEMFAEGHFRSKSILALLTMVGLGLLAVGVAFWKKSREAHYRALYDSEVKLRVSLEKHSITLKAVGDAVIVTDEQGCVDFLNPVAENLTGWSHAEAQGQRLDTVFHIVNEQTRDEVESPVKKVLREGEIVGLANHTVLIARDGTERPIADLAAPIRDDKGTILGVVLVFRDQTTEHNYKMLFQQMLDAFAVHEILCDERGLPINYRFLDVNPTFERMTGLKACDIAGRKVLDVLPGTEQEWIDRYGKVALTGESTSFESYSKELKKHFFVRAFRPLPNQFATIFMDITERLQMEEQLAQTLKMETVGRLAGGIAHDFNNMLGVILGNAEQLLEKLQQTDPLREETQSIITAAKRSSEMTRQLLAFARKQIIKPRILDLNEAVEGCLRILRRLIGENIHLVWDSRSSECRIKMDPVQIDQVLTNLCVNARDAISDVGVITIKTSMTHCTEEDCADHPECNPGEYVLLSVSDTGSGMSSEVLSHLFEPFYTTKDVGEGTGLGLATVHGIISQNGGFINVESQAGSGSTFHIFLPAQKTPIQEQQPVEKSAIREGHGEVILVAEDEPTLLKLSATMLTRLGYQVLSASTPEEALKLAEMQTGGLDLLLSDVVMPGMNGKELGVKIRALHPTIKILFMSGYTADVIANHGILDQGVHFIQKPFTRNDIAAQVDKCLRG